MLQKISTLTKFSGFESFLALFDRIPNLYIKFAARPLKGYIEEQQLFVLFLPENNSFKATKRRILSIFYFKFLSLISLLTSHAS